MNVEPSMSSAPTGARLHMGIAERGKLHALAGDHGQALHYYRTAMRVAVEANEPEIFFRHYLECVMESLELMGALDEVLAYCDRAIALYAERPPPNPIAVFDLASIHLRRGVVLLKRGEAEAAGEALQAAIATAKRCVRRLDLAATLLRWVRAGFQLDGPRVLAEQRRAGYFTVRRETVDPGRAVELTDHAGPFAR